MKKLIKITVIAFATLLLSCIGLAALGSTLPRSETTPAAAVVTTSAPAPTDAPRPTAAPKPTAEPVVSEAQEVAAYGRTMVRHSSAISQALTDIGRLSQNPRLNDLSWKIDMAAAFETLRSENAAVQQITPPASMRDVHTEVLAATADLDAMTYRYAAGIDAMDASEIRAAIALMQSGARHINRATELMKAK